MSLESVVEALQTALNSIEDIDDIEELGIPDAALSGPWDRIYLEPSEEIFEYGDLYAAEVPTSSIARCTVLMVLHTDNVPEGQTLLKYTLDKVKDIREKLQSGNDPSTGDFKNDGDQGFRAEMEQVRYHFRPGDPVSAAIIPIIVKAYN